MTQGRPTKGSDIVTKFDASAEAKEKVRLVLDTLAGKTSVQDAAARLNVTETRFHQIRDEILTGMLSAAEPKPVGRPPEPEEDDPEVEALRKKLQEANLMVEISRLRELIAVAFPELVAAEAERRKKKRLSRILTNSSPPDSTSTSS